MLFKRRKASVAVTETPYAFDPDDTVTRPPDEENAPSDAVDLPETKTRGSLLGRLFRQANTDTLRAVGNSVGLPSAPPHTAAIVLEPPVTTASRQLPSPERRASCFQPFKGGTTTTTAGGADAPAPGETRSGIQIASAAVAVVNKDLDSLLMKLEERVVAADANDSRMQVTKNPLVGVHMQVVPPHLMPVEAEDDGGHFSSAAA